MQPEGTGKVVFEVSDDVLKHADVGDFTIDPRTALVSKMKGGGHGQPNIQFLKENNIEFNIVKTYQNGVRVGNVPSHKTVGKREGIGQSWFPENWNKNDIKDAGEYIFNLVENSKTVDGQVLSGMYKNVVMIITERKALHPNDPAIEKYWERLTEILSESSSETIELFDICSEEEILYLSEVFEDVAYNLHDELYIECLERLLLKYPNIPIADSIKTAKQL